MWDLQTRNVWSWWVIHNPPTPSKIQTNKQKYYLVLCLLKCCCRIIGKRCSFPNMPYFLWSQSSPRIVKYSTLFSDPLMFVLLERRALCVVKGWWFFCVCVIVTQTELWVLQVLHWVSLALHHPAVICLEMDTYFQVLFFFLTFKALWLGPIFKIVCLRSWFCVAGLLPWPYLFSPSTQIGN